MANLYENSCWIETDWDTPKLAKNRVLLVDDWAVALPTDRINITHRDTLSRLRVSAIAVAEIRP